MQENKKNSQVVENINIADKATSNEEPKKELTKAERARIKIWEPEAIKVEGEKVLIGEREYLLVHNHRDAFNPEEFSFRFSEVLAKYDYIVGDWGFESLRLKGFFDSLHKKFPADRRIETLQDYLYEYCNFGCAFFVLERIGGEHERGRIPKEEFFDTKRKKRKPNPRKKYEHTAHIDEKQTKDFVKKNKRVKPQNNNKKKQTTKNDNQQSKRPFVIRKKED